MLSSSRGQANFRGLEASRPRPRTWPSRPRPRTSKCILKDVLEAKDVLEDSRTSLASRWSPRGRPWSRGQILKSLASKPQVLENCPVLGSRTALFLNRWNFVGKRHKPCGKSAKTFFWFSQVEIAWKKIFWRPFFWEHLRQCPWPWPREGLSLALKFFRVLGLGLEPCLLDSTSVLNSLG